LALSLTVSFMAFAVMVLVGVVGYLIEKSEDRLESPSISECPPGASGDHKKPAPRSPVH
jgi:hypothetical protein